MKTKEQIIEELFYKPETQDWYKPVLKAMEMYAQQLRQPIVSGALPLDEIIGYLERLQNYLGSGDTYCFDNEHDLNDSEQLEKFITSLRK